MGHTYVSLSPLQIEAYILYFNHLIQFGFIIHSVKSDGAPPLLNFLESLNWLDFHYEQIPSHDFWLNHINDSIKVGQ